VRRVGGRVTRPFSRGLSRDIARRAAAGGELFVPSRPLHDDDLAIALGPEGRAAAERRPPETHVEELRARLRERRPDADYLTWMGYASIKTHLVEDFLQRLDKMGMRHAVEGRVPLLDPVLVRWAFRLSQREKIGAYRQKALLREAVTPLLPRYVLDRPKQGFSAPVGAWTEELLHDRTPADSSLFAEGIVQRGALPRLRERNGSFAEWTLAVLLAWAERNVA
jgi:asparagine synthetase B (glutamine-hydrolysing)